MSVKELGYGINVPSPDALQVYSIRINITDVEDGVYHMGLVYWESYCEQLHNDIHHNMYDVYLAANDIVDLIEKVVDIIQKHSS